VIDIRGDSPQGPETFSLRSLLPFQRCVPEMV
jgi:hypothetical protein